jgi:hypothetical protein
VQQRKPDDAAAMAPSTIGAQEHGDRGQRHAGHEHPADVVPRRPGAAAEQDERQRHDAVALRQGEVLELDPEQPSDPASMPRPRNSSRLGTPSRDDVLLRRTPASSSTAARRMNGFPRSASAMHPEMVISTQHVVTAAPVHCQHHGRICVAASW